MRAPRDCVGFSGQARQGWVGRDDVEIIMSGGLIEHGIISIMSRYSVAESAAGGVSLGRGRREGAGQLQQTEVPATAGCFNGCSSGNGKTVIFAQSVAEPDRH